MKAALLADLGLLEVDKAAFPSLVDVLSKNRYPKFFSIKSALLAYIGLVEQDKAAFLRKLQVLSKNRYVQFLFAETNFFNALEPPRSR